MDMAHLVSKDPLLKFPQKRVIILSDKKSVQEVSHDSCLRHFFQDTNNLNLSYFSVNRHL